MATTTAILSLTSGDLISDPLSLGVSMELVGAATTTGITKTTGLRRQTFANTNETKVLEADDYVDNKTHFLYVKNISTTAGRYLDNLQVSNIDILFEWTLLYE